MSLDGEAREKRENPLFRALGAVMSLANVVATTWILLIMALVVADVIGRNAFLHPIAGVPEMVKYSIVGIVFLQVAHTHWKGQMIRSDGLVKIVMRTRPRLAACFDFAAQIIGAGFTFLLARAVWPHTVRAYERGEMEGVTGHFTMPVWPFLLIIAGGSALLGMSFLLSAAIALRRIRNPRVE